MSRQPDDTHSNQPADADAWYGAFSSFSEEFDLTMGLALPEEGEEVVNDSAPQTGGPSATAKPHASLGGKRPAKDGVPSEEAPTATGLTGLPETIAHQLEDAADLLVPFTDMGISSAGGAAVFPVVETYDCSGQMSHTQLQAPGEFLFEGPTEPASCSETAPAVGKSAPHQSKSGAGSLLRVPRGKRPSGTSSRSSSSRTSSSNSRSSSDSGRRPSRVQKSVARVSSEKMPIRAGLVESRPFANQSLGPLGPSVNEATLPLSGGKATIGIKFCPFLEALSHGVKIRRPSISAQTISGAPASLEWTARITGAAKVSWDEATGGKDLPNSISAQTVSQATTAAQSLVKLCKKNYAKRFDATLFDGRYTDLLNATRSAIISFCQEDAEFEENVVQKTRQTLAHDFGALGQHFELVRAEPTFVLSIPGLTSKGEAHISEHQLHDNPVLFTGDALYQTMSDRLASI